jgi:predicted nucleotidyltransferase
MKPSEALQAHRTELRLLVGRMGLLHPRVFGSAATGSDAEDSDLDLLVDPPPGTTLLTLAALQNEAERLLGVPVDVQTPRSISVRFRDHMLKTALGV